MQYWPNAVGGIINAVMIFVLNKVYGRIAIVLTDWENHRTISDYNDNLLIKLFLFQFVNSYTSLYYIAFFKSGVKIWGIEALRDRCHTIDDHNKLGSGCSEELSTQLLTLLAISIFLGLFQEVVLPYIKTKIHVIKSYIPFLNKDESGDRAHLLEDSKKIKKRSFDDVEGEVNLNDYEGTIDEYSKIVIQYGYITLFAASFPLAPALALFNNLIEERSDAFKFLTIYNKPFYAGSSGIGGWQFVMECMSVIAVITNCLLIGYSYNAIYQLTNNNAYLTLLTIDVIAVVLLLIKFILIIARNDITAPIRQLIARQTYIQEQLVKKFQQRPKLGGKFGGRGGRGGARRFGGETGGKGKVVS